MCTNINLKYQVVDKITSLKPENYDSRVLSALHNIDRGPLHSENNALCNNCYVMIIG